MKLRSVYRRTIGRLIDGESAAILLYHRVTKLARDPQWLAVPPNIFEEHLRVLSDRFKVLSLREFRKYSKTKSLPPRAVVITFDDGYADNLLEAKPLLDRYKTPAAVFVVSGHIDSAREFWWDELEGLLLAPGPLPAKLELHIGNVTREWNLSDDRDESCDGWNVTKTDVTDRRRVYVELAPLIKTQPFAERERLLTELARWRGIARPQRATHRAMTADEIQNLARSGLVEIGAHTVTHSALSTQSIAQQRDEIQQSRAKLREIVGHEITSFSYPFGTKSDYTTDTVRLVETEGFDNACSNFSGLANRDSARFELPRFLVRDWPAEEFERQLEKFFRS